jgi:hypothetical protein
MSDPNPLPVPPPGFELETPQKPPSPCGRGNPPLAAPSAYIPVV